MRVLREMLTTLIIALAMFFLLQMTIQSSIVVGSSMEPTFRNGERLLINKTAYIFNQPARGEVVIFHPPSSQSTEYIKRVIGLPGDTVEIKDGKVIVNSVKLEEPYISSPPRYTTSKLTIPANSYFVLGDNRNSSNDSHFGWTVPRQNIVGKGWLSWWPPTDWGLVLNYPLEDELNSTTK